MLGDLAWILRRHDMPYIISLGRTPLTTKREKQNINYRIHITNRFGVVEPGAYPEENAPCTKCGEPWRRHDGYRCPPNYESEEDCLDGTDN